jgi:hypothetical protein
MASTAYSSVANPVYNDPKNGGILCQVVFTALGATPVPFVASPSDSESYGAEIFADCVAGKYGAIGAYAAPIATPAQLVAYAQAKQAKIAAAGVTINLGTAAAPLNVSVDTSAAGRVDLTGLAQMAAINPSFSTTWYQASGAITLTAAQLVALGEAVLAWIASTYAALAAVEAAIAASPPTITTTAEIDAAAWAASAS